MSLMARVDGARSRLQAANDQLSGARGILNPDRGGESGEIGDGFSSFFERLKDEASDTWDSITNPIETAKDAWAGLQEAVDDPEQALKEAWNGLKAPFEDFKEDWNEGHEGEAIGRGLAEVVLLASPTKIFKGLKGLGALGGDSDDADAPDAPSGPPGGDPPSGDSDGLDDNDSDSGKDDEDDGDNSELDNNDGAGGGDGVLQGSGFTVNESKFDYFFGRVTSSPHNTERSLQNLEDLKKLGIDEATGGREQLVRIFQEGTSAPEVNSRHISEYGVTITRRVEVSGGESAGAIDVKYFYPRGDLSATPEVSTIIPKIYR